MFSTIIVRRNRGHCVGGIVPGGGGGRGRHVHLELDVDLPPHPPPLDN